MRRKLIAMLIAGAIASAAHSKPANQPHTNKEPVGIEMTTPSFEMFRLAPGKTEAFIRSVADWDKVSMAGDQPPTQLFFHAGGEGWDVLLFKPARPKPTSAQNAAMAAKAKELGLPLGVSYFLQIRDQMADHIHFDAHGPTTAAEWLAELARSRAEDAGN